MMAVIVMRRAFATATLVALLSSGSAGLFAPQDQPHACTDHVCYCRPSARPAPAAEPSCHGTAAPRAATTLQSACDHDKDGFTVATPASAALLPSSPMIFAPASTPLPQAPARKPWLRAARPETPPPRPASC
jgi:hypothetical protein